MNEPLEWFWTAITVLCLGWYSFMTIFVAIRGAADIRGMLTRLRNDHSLIEDVDSDSRSE